MGGHVGVADLLLEHGALADPPATRFVPIFMAINFQHSEIVRKLLAHRANVNRSNSAPLHMAARNGDTEMVKLLLSHGATTDKLPRSFDKFLQECLNESL